MKKITTTSTSVFSSDISGSFLLSFYLEPKEKNREFNGEIFIKKLNINDKTVISIKFTESKDKLVDIQKFIINLRANQKNIPVRIQLYEGNFLRKDFGIFIVNDNLERVELDWDSKLLEDKFGKNLELKVTTDGLVDLEKLPNSIIFVKNIEIIEEIKTKIENLYLEKIIKEKSWNIANLKSFSRSGSTKNNPEVLIEFSKPSSQIIGNQKFIVNFKCNNSLGKISVDLYENNNFIKKLGTVVAKDTNNFNIAEFIWNENDIKDKKGNKIQILLSLDDNLKQGSFYVFENIFWAATVLDNVLSNVNSQETLKSDIIVSASSQFSHDTTSNIIPFPGWPKLPNGPGEIGSFHGIGGPVDYWGNKRAFQIYDDWLGRPGNIIKVFCNSSRSFNNKSWEDIAGGSGSSLDVLSGQFVGHPDNVLKAEVWPVHLPLILQFSIVPDDDKFKNIVNGKWRNPSIYADIKNGIYDNFYSLAFKRLANRCLKIKREPSTVVLRIGHEMNGNWYPWSVGPDKTSFLESWKRIFEIMVKSVESIFGKGKRFLVEFGPSYQIRFGNPTSERLWNLYPGNDYVDVIGLGIHDNVGMKTQNDWDKNLKKNDNQEGWQDYYDWAYTNTNKWLGTSEIESNYIPRLYFPKTENMDVFWTTGFEVLRKRYVNRFLYFTYLTNGGSYLWRSDGWGEPYRKLYGIGKK